MLIKHLRENVLREFSTKEMVFKGSHLAQTFKVLKNKEDYN